MGQLTRSERVTLAVARLATLLTLLVRLAGVAEVAVFAVATVALAGLAAVVGDAVEQLGGRFGPGATGVPQSALGNLPELFIAIFALRSGLVGVVQAALVGSIMANTLLVLGLAFLVGGVRHGRQRFDSEPPRIIATLMLLAVAALILPNPGQGAAHARRAARGGAQHRLGAAAAGRVRRQHPLLVAQHRHPGAHPAR
jgi:Ca2+:H+ antiporter